MKRCLALLWFFLAIVASASEPARLLCFRHLVVPAGRRIAAVRIDIFGVRVSAFPKIPADWHISLELEGSWRSRVQGECQHGVGGLSGSKDLDGIVAAESDDWSSVRIEGIVYVTQDFDHLEEIKVDGTVAAFEKPNQSLEPTPSSVTPRADARVAPAAVVAHL